MISRKVIILSLLVLAVLYFAFNFYVNPTDNQEIAINNMVFDSSATEGNN